MRTLLLVAAQAIASLGVVAVASPDPRAALAERQSSTYNWIGLVNCWTNPAQGARSELDFFNDKPSSFGSATPDARTVTSSNQNYVWENGGSFTYGDQSDTKFTFSLNDNVKSQSAGAQVGAGNAGNTDYVIFKDKGTTLYSQPPYGCQVFYYAVPKAQAGSASGGSASTAASTTTGAASTSGASAASSATSNVPSPTAAPENPTSATPGSPAATATPSSSSPSSAPASGSSSSGLSQSATVGVGVGVGIGGAALLAAIGFLLWRYRGQRKENQALQNRVRGLEPGIENMGPREKQGIESYHARPPGIDNNAARYS